MSNKENPKKENCNCESKYDPKPFNVSPPKK